MKFESEREAQAFAQTLHGINDIIRFLEDVRAARNAEFGKDLHNTLVKLRDGFYIKVEPITMQQILEAPGPHG